MKKSEVSVQHHITCFTTVPAMDVNLAWARLLLRLYFQSLWGALLPPAVQNTALKISKRITQKTRHEEEPDVWAFLHKKRFYWECFYKFVLNAFFTYSKDFYLTLKTNSKLFNVWPIYRKSIVKKWFMQVCLEQTIRRTKQKKFSEVVTKMSVTWLNTVPPWECHTVKQWGPFFEWSIHIHVWWSLSTSSPYKPLFKGHNPGKWQYLIQRLTVQILVHTFT